MTTWQIARTYGNDDVRNDDVDVDGDVDDEERRSLEERDIAIPFAEVGILYCPMAYFINSTGH